MDTTCEYLQNDCCLIASSIVGHPAAVTENACLACIKSSHPRTENEVTVSLARANAKWLTAGRPSRDAADVARANSAIVIGVSRSDAADSVVAWVDSCAGAALAQIRAKDMAPWRTITLNSLFVKLCLLARVNSAGGKALEGTAQRRFTSTPVNHRRKKPWPSRSSRLND